jgi:xylulokinase
MALIAIDIGTTHCKAGLFSESGSVIKIVNKPMISHQSSKGWAYYDPPEVLKLVSSILDEITKDNDESISAIGIASMAETGLLVDKKTGEACSPLIPWFETISQPNADLILDKAGSLECYLRFGLKVNFKSSLAKILWLSEQDDYSLKNKHWLSTADYIAYYLTGNFATDYSLAGRTLAFSLDKKDWDHDWLNSWGIREDLFPPVFPSGTPIGKVSRSLPGISSDIPVSICGHDHVCASLAVGAIETGIVFDSMGTAETLIGVFPERPITEEDFRTGLQYGCHVTQGMQYWMGGNSASGGSIEWMRGLLGSSPLSYDELDEIIAKANSGPTGILYFPYLLGSGSPHTDPRKSGAFIGLTMAHKTEEIFKAVLEGVAYEIELIRRAGEKISGQPIRALIAAGGGTRNPAWMQIKSDITGCEINVLSQPEATLLGAVIAAGIGIGLYDDNEDALNQISTQILDTYHPDTENHDIYGKLFNEGYLKFQEPLHDYSKTLDESLE